MPSRRRAQPGTPGWIPPLPQARPRACAERSRQLRGTEGRARHKVPAASRRAEGVPCPLLLGCKEAGESSGQCHLAQEGGGGRWLGPGALTGGQRPGEMRLHGVTGSVQHPGSSPGRRLPNGRVTLLLIFSPHCHLQVTDLGLLRSQRGLNQSKSPQFPGVPGPSGQEQK